ncbi:MAG: restriction endonuclease subunit S [Crocinitomicaceae bacterium]|nr:restriction endonuclease subunit S [Crocinitomicaceae bacterium]
MKQGWEIKKLGEVIVENKKSTTKSKGNEGGEFPFFISGKNIKTINQSIIDGRNIFLPTGGNFYVHFYDGAASYSTDTWSIRTKYNSDIKYLFFFLLLNEDLIGKKHFKGATIKHLQKNDFKDIEIPLPSLPEQQRIVSILDEAFAAIAKAKTNAQQNLQNAKELFESYLDDLFTKLFDTSEKKIISDVAKVIGGYSFKSTDFTTKGKYQVIRMGNVRPGVIRENESPVFIDKLDEKALTKALLQLNDVIITQTGTKKKRDYGFTVIIEKENYLLNQRIASIRFSDKYLPKFFLYFSWTNIFKDQYFANETGTVGQGNVGIGAITDAEIPFIPVKKQMQIIDRIDELRIETQKLEAIYQKKISDLEELKKSVLQKAFSGELKTTAVVV